MATIRHFALRFALLASAMLAVTTPAFAQGGSQLALSAIFSGENKAIPHGLIWRVFKLDGDNDPVLIKQSNDAAPVLALPTGEYIVHVAYGFASSSRRVLVGSATTTERVPIGAGALVVKGSIQDQIIPINRLQVSVYAAGQLRGQTCDIEHPHR
jgi:hypothetical protein